VEPQGLFPVERGCMWGLVSEFVFSCIRVCWGLETGRSALPGVQPNGWKQVLKAKKNKGLGCVSKGR